MHRRLPPLSYYFTLLIVVFCVTLGSTVSADGATGTIERVSVNSAGVEGNSISYKPAISSDGRYVAFESQAGNLIAGDTNDWSDIFVHDRQTGETTRVSISSAGAQSNGDSFDPALSSDGRYVAFYSNASNLVAADTNEVWDIFVHDRETGQTTRVSVSSTGEQSNDNSFAPALSDDGRYVAFYGSASNLVAGDANGKWDVFVHDQQTGDTTLVSVSTAGVQDNSGATTCDISGDGRYVAFHSYASNLVAGDTNNTGDVFVHDRETGETTRVSITTDGGQGDGTSDFPDLSTDGRYVAFYSAAHLIDQDQNGYADIFVHDRETGQTTVVSVNASGVTANNASFSPTISADGRYVAFESYASDLGSGDTFVDLDVFVHDRETGQTKNVSVSSAGVEGNGFSLMAAITGDGRYVTFSSEAYNLVADDTNEVFDIFVYDRDGVAGAPEVTSFSPTSGPIGTSVTINGTNLTGATAVTFNDTNQPTFTMNPDGTQITASVPAGATTGKIAVTTPGGTATSDADFTVTVAAPAITSFSPTTGPVGTSVTINGTNLTGATAVSFNDTGASFTVNSATKITAIVPGAATTGKISVTTPGGTATSAADFTVTAAPSAPIYLSSTGAGKVSGKAFTNADILSYDKVANAWDILYDGSYIKTAQNVGAFAFEGNDILLGFSANQVIAGVGTFAAHDLARFTPTSLGLNNTAGSFAWFFDGSDVGLSTTGEKLDALWIDASGRLYISTTGSGSVPANSAQPTGAKVAFQDEDILRFTPSSTGATTAGTWTLYWNPTAMTGMKAEDINGYWEDPATGDRYVTILGAFTVGNKTYGGAFKGNGKSILRFAPHAGAPGGWAPAESVVWLAPSATFPSNIDGIEMGR